MAKQIEAVQLFKDIGGELHETEEAATVRSAEVVRDRAQGHLYDMLQAVSKAPDWKKLELFISYWPDVERAAKTLVNGSRFSRRLEGREEPAQIEQQSV